MRSVSKRVYSLSLVILAIWRNWDVSISHLSSDLPAPKGSLSIDSIGKESNKNNDYASSYNTTNIYAFEIKVMIFRIGTLNYLKTFFLAYFEVLTEVSVSVNIFYNYYNWLVRRTLSRLSTKLLSILCTIFNFAI